MRCGAVLRAVPRPRRFGRAGAERGWQCCGVAVLWGGSAVGWQCSGSAGFGETAVGVFGRPVRIGGQCEVRGSTENAPYPSGCAARAVGDAFGDCTASPVTSRALAPPALVLRCAAFPGVEAKPFCLPCVFLKRNGAGCPPMLLT